eukprot:TRINITY_DN15439_c4_g1_i1.p1 TRINITY_DN15439_c4_g1~~TRINITY_DN15439_c4_g1_i1.p1  ORF type:complete len:531 (+),score=146.21 TRINITY_DN15439_c4_g1_i1:80-1594(+)
MLGCARPLAHRAAPLAHLPPAARPGARRFTRQPAVPPSAWRLPPAPAARFRFGCAQARQCSSAAGVQQPPPPPPQQQQQQQQKQQEEDGAAGIDRRVWPIAASVLIKGIAFGAFLPAMPLFATSIGLTPSQVGLVMSAGGFARLVSNAPSAVIVEHCARIPTMVGAQVLGAAAMVGHALSTSLATLLFWRVLFSGVSCLHYAAAQEYVADISGASNRAQTNAPVIMAWNMGFSLGPAVGGLAADCTAIGAAAPFVLSGGLLAAAAVSTLCLVGETKPHRRFSLQPPPPAPDPPAAAQSPQQDAVQSAESVLSKFAPLLRQSGAVRAACLAQALLWITTSGCQFTLLPMHGIALGLRVTDVGVVFGLMSVVTIAASPVFARISDRYGRKPVVLPSLLLCGCATFAVSHCTGMWDLCAATMAWSAGIAGAQSGLFPYVQDSVTAESRTAALTLYRTSMDVGITLGGLIFAPIAQALSLPAAFQASAVVCSLACLAFAVLAPSPARA